MTALTGPEREYSPNDQRRDAWLVVTFAVACLAVVGWIFKTGYRLKN